MLRDDDPEFECEVCGMKDPSADAQFFEINGFPLDGATICVPCYWDHVKIDCEPDAKEYAIENCEITEDFPVFESHLAWAVTPEEYENGFKECYTTNSHRAFCRHKCTNYDSLIADLQRMNPVDSTYYQAIRDRIDELVDERIESMEGLELDSESDSDSDSQSEKS